MTTDWIKPAAHFETVSPSDATSLVLTTGQHYPYPRSFRAGTAGDVTVKKIDGNTELIPNVLAGEIVPVIFTHIMDTGTDASSGFTVFYW